MLPTALAALLCLPPLAAQAISDELTALRAAGTPRLALSVIDAEQPPPGTDRDGWLAWERERLELLQTLEEWTVIESRVAGHPTGLPGPFTEFSRTLRAEAALARGDAETARVLLRTLAWRDQKHDKARLQRWRELLIHAYLDDDLTRDAYLAMLRYRQDYGNDDPRLRELGARILLLAGRPDAALAALGDATDPTADALRMLAELRAGRAPSETVAVSAEQQARALTEDPRAAARYWAVAVTAATLGERDAERVAMLEAGLPSDRLPPVEAPFGLEPSDLWQAYRDHGEALANRAQLLVGQDAAWLAYARSRSEADPITARALFATLIQRSRDAELRAASHAAFGASLAATPRGPALIARLYLEDDAPAGSANDLPPSLRQQLVDTALESGDKASATRLYRDLDVPPAEVDAFAWRLRRASLLVEVDPSGAGSTALLALVRDQPERAAAELDTLLPPIAVLQRADAHRDARAVLETLLAAPQGDPATHRSLLLALAKSQEAVGAPRDAARSYLYGAWLPGTDPDDPEGRAARHAAARALVAAGVEDDAIALLDDLVADTPDKARAPLEAELTRLREKRR